MTVKKNQQVKNLQVTEGLTVSVIPSSDHEFLMSTHNVATGYGVSEGNIRNHLHRNQAEFQKGKHYDSAVCFSNSGLQTVHNKVFWTKRGIIRLGFFIKSQQARMFRDWAEDLVLQKIDPQRKLPLAEKPNPKEEYRELYELVEAAAAIAGSKNKLGERLGISSSTFSHILRRPWLVSVTQMGLIERGCRNIIHGGRAQTDVKAVESLLQIEDRESRMYLFAKMRKGGLL